MRVLKSGAAVLLIAPNNCVWLAERDAAKTMPHCFECPGGERVGSERYLDTARREVLEETGLYIASDRFDYRGTLQVDGWEMALYMVNLTNGEVPKDTEETKRSPWVLGRPEAVPLRWCTPSLGALLAIVLQERREKAA